MSPGTTQMDEMARAVAVQERDDTEFTNLGTTFAASARLTATVAGSAQSFSAARATAQNASKAAKPVTGPDGPGTANAERAAPKALITTNILGRSSPVEFPRTITIVTQ